jgi:hypothetical protein
MLGERADAGTVAVCPAGDGFRQAVCHGEMVRRVRRTVDRAVGDAAPGLALPVGLDRYPMLRLVGCSSCPAGASPRTLGFTMTIEWPGLNHDLRHAC